MNQSKVLITVLLALLILGGGFYLWKIKTMKQEVLLVPEDRPVETMTDPVDAALNTSDWKTYRNEEYGFEFKLSDEYSIPENEKNTIGERSGTNILDPKKTEYLFNSRKGLKLSREVQTTGDASKIVVRVYPDSMLVHNNFEDWIRQNASTSYLTIGKNSLRNSNEVIFVSWNSICDDYSAFFLRREYLLELNTCASLYFSGVTNFKDDYFSAILNSVQF